MPILVSIAARHPTNPQPSETMPATLTTTAPSSVYLYWTEGDFHDRFVHGCEDATLTPEQFDHVLLAALDCQNRADAKYPEYVGCYCKVKARLDYADGLSTEWRFEVNSAMVLKAEFAQARVCALQAKVREIEAELAGNA